MDLGFGSSNQKVGNLTQQALLATTQAQEAALQQELDQVDALLHDNEALAQLRAKRLQQLQAAQQQKQAWQAAGHGVYRELINSQDARDVAQEFFNATKASERVVVHFYRPSTPLCDVFHKHLEQLAAQHLETKFLKINVQDCDVGTKGASYLVDKLGIVVMPTLVLIQNRQVVHQVRGFDELGGMETFSTAALARLLVRYNVLFEKDVDDDDDDEKEDRYKSRGGGVNSIQMSRGRNQGHEEDEEEY